MTGLHKDKWPCMFNLTAMEYFKMPVHLTYVFMACRSKVQSRKTQTDSIKIGELQTPKGPSRDSKEGTLLWGGRNMPPLILILSHVTLYTSATNSSSPSQSPENSQSTHWNCHWGFQTGFSVSDENETCQKKKNPLKRKTSNLTEIFKPNIFTHHHFPKGKYLLLVMRISLRHRFLKGYQYFSV